MVTERVHAASPADLVETAFFRIYRDNMADVPIHNKALSVEAVDFQIWQGHWLGILITPWSLSVLLVPGRADGWDMPGANQRRFVKFPAGNIAFLGNEEPELGEFQSCALFSSMAQFRSQSEAVQAARAALLALFKSPDEQPPPPTDKPSESSTLSRRRLFGLGRT